MIFGIAEIIVFGLVVDWLFRKAHLPGLIGLLLFGVVIGPFGLRAVNEATYQASYDLRLFALIVILLRAGFELSKEALAKVGFRAVLISFIPCLMEVLFVTVSAPLFLGLSHLESAMLGSVLAAVSPAVVVPLMIKLMHEGRGIKKGIPTLVLAGASVDDAVAIVLCSSCIGLYVGQQVNLIGSLAAVPISVLTGIATGLLVGGLLFLLFRRFNPRATKRVLTLFAIAILLMTLQKHIAHIIPFAALIAIMSIGFVILEKDEHMAHEISSKLGKIWVFAQLLLFTLVGAQVKVPVALSAGGGGLLVILIGLAGRSLGVQLCLLGSIYSLRERLFVTIAYLPKATVQAAIGGAPLAAMTAAGMNAGPGELILAIAVMSILLTAPVGAILIQWTSTFLLDQAENASHYPAEQAALESR